jgi:hypothetical protein
MNEIVSVVGYRYLNSYGGADSGGLRGIDCSRGFVGLRGRCAQGYKKCKGQAKND